MTSFICAIVTRHPPPSIFLKRQQAAMLYTRVSRRPGQKFAEEQVADLFVRLQIRQDDRQGYTSDAYSLSVLGGGILPGNLAVQAKQTGTQKFRM